MSNVVDTGITQEFRDELTLDHLVTVLEEVDVNASGNNKNGTTVM